jgi:signal transduction histidine kinase/CheY-like chemotaxis protein
MEADNLPTAAPGDDRSRPALECACRWLSAPAGAPTSPGALLEELARAFAAAGAGVARLADGESVARFEEAGVAAPPLPWQERPALIDEVAQSPSALAVGAGGASWLLTALDGAVEAPWLLWMHAPADRQWSPAEAGALTLVGGALSRQLRRSEDSPRLAARELIRLRQQRFDEAAAAARRIAHDYGNVLTGILGFCELAQGQLPPNGTLASYLDEIHRATLVGQRLTNALRLCARRQWPHEPPARLGAVIAHEARGLRQRFPKTRLDTQVPADLPPVALGAEPLGHVLAQLLDNAAEAVAAGGSVRLSGRVVALTADECRDLLGAADQGPHVELSVEDTGCGLSDDARRKLLSEPFFTTKTRHRGYGLGAVHGILCSHRGALAVGPAAGGGTAARVYLPVAAPAAPPSPGERVLVVDDDPMVLHLVRTTLQRAGYRVETAASADDAVRSYTQAAEPFRLVLSDLVMPHVSGLDLARQLQTHDAGVNVLFMSGQAVVCPPPGGQFELLAKPFRPEGLLRAVRFALERGPRGVPAADRTGDVAVHPAAR